MGGIGAGGSPAGQGSGGIAEKLSPTLRKPLSPPLATRVEKPSTKNTRGAFHMTTVPGVSAARFARFALRVLRKIDQK